MAKNKKQSELSQEQIFLHKGFASLQLKDALLSLMAVELCSKCIAIKTVVPALIRDAVIQYGSVFKLGNVIDKRKHKLDTSIIPEQYQKLHQQIITYRDQLFAHIDFTARNPVKIKNGKEIFYEISNKGPKDFIDKIPEMKAVIIHIMNKLGSEIIEQHNELLHKELNGLEAV